MMAISCKMMQKKSANKGSKGKSSSLKMYLQNSDDKWEIVSMSDDGLEGAQETFSYQDAGHFLLT